MRHIKLISLTIFLFLCLVSTKSSSTMMFSSVCGSAGGDHYLIASGNWNGAVWASTIVGTPTTGTPTSTSVVCLSSNIGSNFALNINVAASFAQIDGTGYTGTLTDSAQNLTMTSGGQLLFVSGMTIAGTGTVILPTTSTITSGGNVIPWAFTATATNTEAFGDSTTISGLLTTPTSVTTLNGSGFTLTLRGGWACGATTNNVTGSLSSIVFANGTFTFAMTSAQLITIPTIEVNNGGSGSITLVGSGSGGLRLNGETFKYTSGTLTTTGAPFTCVGCTVTNNSTGLLFDTFNASTGAETWNGTSGFAINNYSNLVSGVVTTMLSGNTYTINTSIVDTGTFASHNSFTSGGTATLNYTGAATSEAVAYVDVTNSSNSGTNIYDYQGTVTGITGWTKGTNIGSGSGGGAPGHIIGGDAMVIDLCGPLKHAGIYAIYPPSIGCD